MKIRQCYLVVVIILSFLQGCSFDRIVSNDKYCQHLTKNDIINVTKEFIDISEDNEPHILDPDLVTINIAAQILKLTYNQYKKYGLTETDFNRMPDNSFKENLEKLYNDLKPLMENNEL